MKTLDVFYLKKRKMKIYYPILFFAFLTFFACKKKEQPHDDPIFQDPELALNLVTGIQMRDANGQAIGNAGNPNVKNGEIGVFPNPMVDVANVFIIDGFLEEIWILPGTQNKDFSDLDFNSILENHKVPLDSITENKIMEFGLPDDQDVQAANLNLSNLETGYYRIFCKTASGEIFWDNLKIDKESDPGERISNLLDEWK